MLSCWFYFPHHHHPHPHPHRGKKEKATVKQIEREREEGKAPSHLLGSKMQDGKFGKTANLLLADENCHDVNQESSAAFIFFCNRIARVML